MADFDTHTTGGRRPFQTQTLYRNGVYSGTLAGNVTLTKRSPQLLKLDPGGAGRDVTLPAVENGLWFEIANAADAAETLTVKNAAGSTIVAIPQNRKARVACTTSAWIHMGIETIALS